MALVKCKECGEKVSTKATSCPSCGAKVPKRTSLATWLGLALIIYIAYAALQSPTSTTSSTNTKSNKSANIKQQVAPKTSWTHSTSKDEMTGKKMAFASSVSTTPTKLMSFPYHDTIAWLGVGCDGKTEWAFVGFNESPNLTDTDTEDGYNVIKTRIKWDGKVENISMTQKWGAKFIHFEKDRSIISKISKSKSVLLELHWHGEQPSYFDFPLKGSSAALKKIRELCAKK